MSSSSAHDFSPSVVQGFLQQLRAKVEAERDKRHQAIDAEECSRQRKLLPEAEGFPGIAERQRELEERKRDRENLAVQLVAEAESRKAEERRRAEEEEVRRHLETLRRKAEEDNKERGLAAKADAHREKRLTKAVMLRFRLFLRLMRRNDMKARRFADACRLERAFAQWKQLLSLAKLRLEEKEASDDIEADAFYGRIIARRAMIAWLCAATLQRQKFRLVRERVKARLVDDSFWKWRKAANVARKQRIEQEARDTAVALQHHKRALIRTAFRSWLTAMPELREERQSILTQEKLWLRSQLHLMSLAKGAVTISPPRREVPATATGPAPGSSPLVSSASLAASAPVKDDIGELIRSTRQTLDKLSSGKAIATKDHGDGAPDLDATVFLTAAASDTAP